MNAILRFNRWQLTEYISLVDDLISISTLLFLKEVKVLGLKIADKGSGSGTDQAKLEELEQQAEDARRKAVELREQLDELYTGTTETTIVDSIISGLKEGKRSVKDFADDFKGYILWVNVVGFMLQGNECFKTENRP